jgi:transcriptional regulator with XRE-family HTH domain
MVLDETSSIQYDSGMVKKPPKELADQLRQAIDDCGLTRYEIAKRTGIDQSALGKFYNGQRGMNLKAAGKLCEYLGLRLTAERPARGRAKPKRKPKGG